MSDLAGRAVGFVGLGNMGTPMVARLTGAGLTVRAFDIDETARARTVARGALEARSLAELAGSEVVILMLPNSAVVEAVVHDPAFADALTPGVAVVDMSSSVPTRTRELARELEARGVTLVDAPVSGGVTGAERGSLAVLVGGADAAVAPVLPVLERFGRVVRTGPIGSGHATKALNNLVSATHLWITSEAIAAGERFGLDPAVLVSAFNGSSGRSGSSENKWPNFILPRTFDSGFGLQLMLKDVLIGVDLGEQVGAPIRLGRDVAELWSEAAHELPPTADHTEVAVWIEHLAGNRGWPEPGSGEAS